VKPPAAFWEALCGVLARASTLGELGAGLVGLAGPTPLAFERHENGRWLPLWSDLAGTGRAILPLGDWGRLRLSTAAKVKLAPAAGMITAAAVRLERAPAAPGSAGRTTRLTRLVTAAQQRIDQQQTILDAVLDTAPVGIVLTDQNGNLMLHNRRFLALFGFEGALPMGMDMGRLRRFFVDSRRYVTWLHGLPDVPGKTVELELWQTEPQSRFLSLMTSPAYDPGGQLMGRLFIIRDMTQQANVDRMKTELINVVSHELRTPLTSVLGFAELVLIRDLPTDKVRQYVGTIYAEGKRLSALLDDFLDINRLESRQQPYHMRSLQLAPVIRKVAALFATDDRHPIETDLPPSLPPVRADADRLVQALSNLVSNAIKYSPDGGPVRIRTELQPEQQRLVVRVQDWGLGIPASAIGNLFSKFFRVHRPGHEGIGGTGLGLAIVSEIIKAHGGDLWVDSVEGEGSTFSFALPVRSRHLPGRPVAMDDPVET
jgi:PAS domain S-box-containing protein